MIKIKKNTPERFRTIPDQQIYSPFDIDLYLYEVHGYLLGERIDKTKGLSLAHFDTIQIIKKSKNPKNGLEFVHAHAHRIANQEFTILILKLK